MSKGLETRRRILDHALSVVSLEGLEGVTLGRLATDLGMSKSGLFAHFESKEELQLEVLDAAAQRFREVVVAPALAEVRGEPRVRALFARWMTWERSEGLPGGCPFIHAAAEFDDQPGRIQDKVVELQRQWFDTVARSARIAVDSGHFRRDLDAELFSTQLLGIVLGYHHAARLLRDPDAESRAWRAFEAVISAARA